MTIKIKLKEEEAKRIIKIIRQTKEILHHDNDLLKYVDYGIYRISQNLLLRRGSLFPPQGFGTASTLSLIASSSGSGNFSVSL